MTIRLKPYFQQELLMNINPNETSRIKLMQTIMTTLRQHLGKEKMNASCLPTHEKEVQDYAKNMLKSIQQDSEKSAQDCILDLVKDMIADNPNIAFGLIHHIKNKDTFELLVRAGCDLSKTDDKGNTLLHLLSEKPHYVEGLVDLLVQNNVPVNAKNNNQQTPLHTLMDMYKTSYMKDVLQNGGNPNIQNKEGNTPLMVAVLEGDGALCKLLCELGANPMELNNNGLTPIAKAHICCMNEMMWKDNQTEETWENIIQTLEQYKPKTQNLFQKWFSDRHQKQ